MSGTYLSKIPVLVVALVIGIVLVTSAVVPLASDYSEAKTFTNEGYYRMQKITADDTTVYTLTWDKSTDKILLNGEEVDIGDHSQYTGELGVSVVMTDKSVSRYTTNLRIQSWATSFSGSIGFGANTMKIVLNNGTETITENEGTESEASRTATYDYAYFASNTGDYIMKDKIKSAYVNSESEVCAVGVTNINTSSTPLLSVLTMTGDASDVEFNAIIGATTATFSDVQITAPEVSGYVDLYSLQKVTATATYDGEETDLTYSYFAVPYQVDSDPDNPAAYKNLVKVVPLMAFIMLVVAAAGMVYLKNKD